MKKKITLLFVIALAVLSGVNVMKYENKSILRFLRNVEALASNENISGIISCSGNGSVYCPLTKTSDYKEVVMEEL